MPDLDLLPTSEVVKHICRLTSQTRTHLGLSMSEVADEVSFSNYQTYGHYETRRRRPRLAAIIMMVRWIEKRTGCSSHHSTFLEGLADHCYRRRMELSLTSKRFAVVLGTDRETYRLFETGNRPNISLAATVAIVRTLEQMECAEVLVSWLSSLLCSPGVGRETSSTKAR